MTNFLNASTILRRVPLRTAFQSSECFPLPRQAGHWACIVLLFIAHLASAAPRLAVIAESGEADSASDILTARLSQHRDIELLEREQIRKVFQEQSLAASRGDLANIGHILGADGILLLTVHQQQEPAFMEVRLMAVHPGVVVLEHNYPWPLPNLEEWSNLVGSEFLAIFPKLTVLPRDAVPVSILGLHSALKSTQAESLERELTALLYNRLMKEKEIFVLERRRLELLDDEKQFANSTNSDFWNGSYLLDGIINKERNISNRVTASIRLTPPANGKSLSIEAAGSHEHLPEVASELVLQILAALRKGATSVSWDTATESKEYFNEAQWMFKWGMFPEAKAAAESAWALGLQTSEAAQLRIKSYLGCAADPGYCTLERDPDRVIFVRFNAPRLGDIGHSITFAAPAHPENLGDVLRASELFSDGLHAFTAPADRDTNWVRLATNVVRSASEWLRYFYFTAETRSGHEDELAELRMLTRKIAGWLDERPVNFALGNTNLAWLKGTRGGFWFETPEEGIVFYRKMISAGQWPVVRTRFINHYSYEYASNGSHAIMRSQEEADLSRPCLAGWQWETRRRWVGVWENFIEELCASADPSIKIEGLYLRCSWSWASSDFADRFEQLVDYISKQREKIVAIRLEAGLVRDVNTLLETRTGELTAPLKERIKQSAWPTLAADLAKLREKQERAAWFEPYKEYFRTANDFDLHKFTTMTSGGFGPDEAKELQPLVEEFKARLSSPTGAITLAFSNSLLNVTNEAARKTASWRFGAEANSRDFFIDSFAKRLKDTISPPAATVPSVTQSNVNPHLAAPSSYAARIPPQPGVAYAPNTSMPGGPPRAYPTAGLPMTNAPPSGHSPITAELGSVSFSNILQVSRFWRMPEPAGDGNPPFPKAPLQILQTCFRDGKILLQAGPSQMFGRRQAHFFLINPDTLTFQHAAAEDNTFEFTVMTGRSGRCFDIYQNRLYVGLKESVRRFDFDGERWERIELPASGASQPVRLQNRLFFVTGSSILERLSDGSFRVLASTRRRPAQTILDSLDNFGEYEEPSLFMDRSGVLFAVVKNDLYRLGPQTNDWTRICAIPANGSRRVAAYDDGILVRTGPSGMQSGADLYGFYGPSETVQLLFRKPQDNRVAMYPGRSRDIATPKWWLPGGIDVVNAPAAVAGDNVWILAGPDFRTDSTGQARLLETNGWNGLLMRFTPRQQESKVIPLHFNLDSALLRTDVSSAQYPVFRKAPALLLWTPKGMVVTHNQAPGFWLIPSEQLTAAQTSLQSLTTF